MTYTQMMSDKPSRRPMNKTYLWLFILVGAVFSYVFGDQIGAIEDHIIDRVMAIFHSK